jgi:hypothetical protein
MLRDVDISDLVSQIPKEVVLTSATEDMQLPIIGKMESEWAGDPLTH